MNSRTNWLVLKILYIHTSIWSNCLYIHISARQDRYELFYMIGAYGKQRSRCFGSIYIVCVRTFLNTFSKIYLSFLVKKSNSLSDECKWWKQNISGVAMLMKEVQNKHSRNLQPPSPNNLQTIPRKNEKISCQTLGASSMLNSFTICHHKSKIHFQETNK